MGNDDLLAAFTGDFAQLLAKIRAYPEGPHRRELVAAYKAFHHAGVLMRQLASDAGEIEPFSGGTPDPEKEP